MTRLTHERLQAIRQIRGRSILLFLTDRCPVGCLHCSVDSRWNSPSISDFPLFEEVISWVVAEPFEVVAISGGEPFVERKGLELASTRLASARKAQVIFTSGVWAVSPTPPRWIREVLSRTQTVYLSTDSFHAREIGDDRFGNAARAVVEAGCWLIVQVVDHGPDAAEATSRLGQALGPGWDRSAELNRIEPLLAGRGASQFSNLRQLPAAALGPCGFLASPVVRYDGVALACCNEKMIRGAGPKRLRRSANSAAALAGAAESFHNDPVIRALAAIGPGAMTGDPRFADLADETFSDICDLCWRILRRLPAEAEPDSVMEAATLLVGAG